MQGELREPVHPDPADAAGVVPRPAPAGTVRGLVLETASVKVPVLVLVKALVLDLAQGQARGSLRQQRPRPVVEPSAGRRPREPKPEPHPLPHCLQELESAQALLKREHQCHQPSVPASVQGRTSAPASVTLQPVVRTSCRPSGRCFRLSVMEATQHTIDHPATLFIAIAVGQLNRLVERHRSRSTKAFQVNDSQSEDVSIDPR